MNNFYYLSTGIRLHVINVVINVVHGTIQGFSYGAAKVAVKLGPWCLKQPKCFSARALTFQITCTKKVGALLQILPWGPGVSCYIWNYPF